MDGTLALPAANLAPSTFARTPLRSADDLRRAVLAEPGAFLRSNSSGLDRVLRLDPAGDVLELQSGATWRALADHAAHAVPELARFADDPWMPRTVGQSVAENAPGPDGCPLVAHVQTVALVTPDGLLRGTSRDTDSELFALTVGGYGAFGIPYSVTLRLSSLARSAANPARIETLDLQPAGTQPTDRLVLYVPPEHAEAMLGDARAQSHAWRVPIARIEVRCTQAEAQTRLRWACREYAALALHVHRPGGLGGSVRAFQFQRALIEAAVACGGSFLLSPKAPVAREHVLHCYPTLTTFLADRQRYDPNDRLTNDWTRHFRALLRRDTCEVRWSRA